jgi:NitT/TauT family transport system ATP-binding protein
MTSHAPLKVAADGARPISSTKPLLRIDNVQKRFRNDVVAIADASMSIYPGEFLSLLGPSGCGKSTLLTLVAGISEPSAGVIDWPQASYTATGKPEQTLGFVFQEATLLPWLTTFDNVYLPLKLSGMSRKDAEGRIGEALAQVGLSGFEKAYPRQLSGGMKMRVSIARALVKKPQILLMDEPFAALDEITRTNLSYELLDVFSRIGLTVIFVTHSVYESVFLSSRIVVMTSRPGRILSEIPIDAPYPRTEEYRTSSEYNQYCRQVSAALKSAIDFKHP